MDKQVFARQIQKLREAYPGCFAPPTISAWWEIFEHTSDIAFVKSVQKLIADNPNPKYPPSAEKLEIAIKNYYENNQFEIHQQRRAEEKDIAEEFMKSLSKGEVEDWLKKIRLGMDSEGSIENGK